MNESICAAILAARLHDPPEKALVLMRTVGGHEAGTVRTMEAEVFSGGVPAAARSAAKKADHWAAAADRAAFPNHEDDGRYPSWQQVRFAESPVVIHPLTGQEANLRSLSEVDPAHAEAIATAHMRALVQRYADGRIDLRRTALALWRFGPELDAPDLRNLWPMLPADSRVPDHTIFDHLDLAAAFASSFAADPDGGPALLAVSIGPVQEVIAAGRSTSDLWAGSHLLARMSWEAMRIVCEACGPEAVLFPRLRGIPQVDLWLTSSRVGLPRTLFEREAWTRERSDSNPLFGAALPNRFTAIVPQSQAGELAERIRTHLRRWVCERAEDAFRVVLREAGFEDAPDLAAYAQIRQQLRDFPEVHWAAVPWSLVGTDADGKVAASDGRLAEAFKRLLGDPQAGFLGSESWGLLSGSIELEDGNFWKPNPGTLYPALHELLERVLAACKSTRTFSQAAEEGWRCTQSGEVEWLTTDRGQLPKPMRQRADSVWSKLAQRRPILARAGEHLGALATLKRLWPTLVVAELQAAIGLDIDRFVVSTHSMALAGALRGWLPLGERLPAALAREIEAGPEGRPALPRKLLSSLRKHPDAELLRRLPAWLEEDEDGRARRRIAKELGIEIENYYGLLLLDGDRMGAWVSASDRSLTLRHDQHFHPQIRAALSRFRADEGFARYAREPRAASPSRHMAISDALNQFALRLAPAVVERSCAGRLIYAGGDDVLAMTTVDDLLPAIAGLRAAFAGVSCEQIGFDGPAAFESGQSDGFVLHEGRLCRVMGAKASASAGAVVAHHQAPLTAVMRELKAAEARAKALPGKDAFSLAIIKRSGGALRLTARWGEPLRALLEVRDFLRQPGVSRRAVYHVIQWLRDLPMEPGLVAASVAWQFERQGGSQAESVHLGRLLASTACDESLRPSGQGALEWLCELLQCAEFLAREARGAAPARATAKVAA